MQFGDKKQRRLVPRASRKNTPKEIIKPIQKLYYVLCIVWNEVLRFVKLSLQPRPLFLVATACRTIEYAQVPQIVCKIECSIFSLYLLYLFSFLVSQWFHHLPVIQGKYLRIILVLLLPKLFYPINSSSRIYSNLPCPAPLSLFNTCPNHHHASHGHL